MESLMDMEDHRIRELLNLTKKLQEQTRGLTVRLMFNGFKVKRGFKHLAFSGEVTDALVERLGRLPTTEEVIILVHGGFEHRGATCLMHGRRFEGKIQLGGLR